MVSTGPDHGPHGPGIDPQHLDSRGCTLCSELSGECLECVFAYAVGAPKRSRHPFHILKKKIQTAGGGLSQQWETGNTQQPSRIDVDLHLVQPLGGGNLFQRSQTFKPCGTMNQAIQAAKFRFQGIDQFLKILRSSRNKINGVQNRFLQTIFSN